MLRQLAVDVGAGQADVGQQAIIQAGQLAPHPELLAPVSEALERRAQRGGDALRRRISPRPGDTYGARS